MLGTIFVYLQKNIGKMIVNFETIIFPIYGLMFGINYWNSEMNEDEDESEMYDDTQHCLQFMFLFMGISFVWYQNK